MKFEDVKDKQQLLNMDVLIEHRYNKELSKIVKVLKTGFRVKGRPNDIFSFYGTRKGGGSFYRTFAYLLTPEEAEAKRNYFIINDECREIRLLVTNNLSKLTHAQLLSIKKIIQP